MPITRCFLDWNQPLLPAAADQLIQRYATAEQLDLSNVVTVFTGRRASRRMLELLVEKAADRWPAFLPPRMVTFQRLPEMLYQQQRQLADELTQLLVWKRALSIIPAAELRAALPVIPGEDAVSAWLALCETLHRQHVELAADGLEFDEVFTQLSRLGNRAEAERWKALRRIQSEYLWQMDQLQLWDREAARLVAVQQQECRADFDIVLIGTVDMNRIVRQMLTQVADRVTTLVHAPETEATAFDEFGCLIPDAWETRRLNIPVQSTRIVDQPEQQAQAVVRQLASQSAPRRADEVVIGVANEALVPAILQGLADAGISGRWPVGSEVHSSRPYRLLEAVASHLASARNGQPADFATLSQLVRHPDLDRWIRQSLRRHNVSAAAPDWLQTFDDYLADHLQSTPGVILGPRDTRMTISAVCEAVDRLLMQLLSPADQQRVQTGSRQSGAARQRQLTFDDQLEIRSVSLPSLLARKRPLLEWGQGTLRLLSAIYADYEFGESAHRDEAIGECCRALTDCVEALVRIPDSVMPACTASQAIQLLLRQIDDVTIPPAADDAAIDLLGWLELSMDDSPELILTGFNEGFVPESISSDVFLPNSLRGQLGLLDNRRRYVRDAYALTAMLHSRERVTFIAGRTDFDGNPLTPSRLWLAVEPSQLPARIRWFYGTETVPAVPNDSGSDTTAQPAAEPAAAAAAEPRGARPSGFLVPEPPLIPDAPQQISVTAFRDYLACPYRYFLKHELRLQSVDDETRELTAAAFGNLMHDVLNAFGTSDIAHATTAEPIEHFLLDELRRLAARRFGKNQSATVAVQLQMLADRLRAFAGCQAQLASEGWRIRYTEARLVYSQFKDVYGRPVALKGRVDRIDQHAKTGHWRVLDYKTSETAEKPERTHQRRKSQGNQEWVDLQLPLYRLLVRELEIESNIQLGYVHLPGDLSTVGVSIAKWSEEDLAEAEAVAARTAADILELKISDIAQTDGHAASEFAGVCQDTVIDRQIPWLAQWAGRSVARPVELSLVKPDPE